MPKRKPKYYCLYGYHKADPNKVGYFGEDLSIVADLSAAKVFSTVPSSAKAEGFASPSKWLEFINSDDLSRGYKFHLVQIADPKKKAER